MAIGITGLSSDNITPGVYVEVVLGAGIAGGFAGSYDALLIANKSSAGSATTNTLYTPSELGSEADAISLLGQGSEAHRMWKRFNKSNAGATGCYVICPPESAGADGYLTITASTTATAAGALRIHVGDEFVDVAISVGDTPTVIMAAAEDAVNGQLDWPCTASATGGALTLTAKVAGPRGNSLRGFAQVIGRGVGTTVDVATSTAFAGGTTVDDITAALAAVASRRFYYIIPASSTSGDLDEIMTQVDSMALPLNGMTQTVVAGVTDSSATAITLATGRNNARLELVWSPECDLPPGELAAHMAGLIALEETKFGGSSEALNMSLYGDGPGNSTRMKLRAPKSGARPTAAQIRSSLNNGLSPIRVNDNGTCTLVKRVTTKCLAGASPDYRAREPHKRLVSDRYGDDIKAKFQSQFGSRSIGDDPPRGTTLPADVVTPSIVKASTNALTQSYSDRALVTNVAEIKRDTTVERDTLVRTRVLVRVPLQVIDILDQLGVRVDQIA